MFYFNSLQYSTTINLVEEYCLHLFSFIKATFKEKTMDPIFDLAMIAVVAIMVAFNIYG